MADEERDRDSGVVEGVKDLGRDLSPAKAERRLEEAVEERPLARHLLAWPVVLGALAIAVVVALILLLIASPGIAAVALAVVFFAAWYGLAQLSHQRRRPSEPRGEEDQEEAAGGEEPADREEGTRE